MYNIYKQESDNVKVLITGATSGIGESFVKLLYKENTIIAVGRNTHKLKELEETYNCITKNCDVSEIDNCVKLFEEFKDIDVLINNAGFGDLGYFTDTNLDKEISMINTNITGMHILFKLYLKEMVKKDFGYILNVASVAGFLPGPLMATYYGTKNYVVRLTKGVQYELKKQKSNVYAGLLCPGPVDTNFNKVANSKFNLKSQTADEVALLGIKGMFKKKKVISSSLSVKFARLGSKILPDSFLVPVTYKMQNKKIYK